MKLPSQLFEEALERANDAVAITDASLEPPGPRILYVNRAFEHMTGYDRDEVLGGSPGILQGPWTDRSVIDRLNNALRAGEPFEGETWNYRKDGTPFLLHWTVTPVKDVEGSITHHVAIQEDVTRRRAYQKRRENLETVAALQR